MNYRDAIVHRQVCCDKCHQLLSKAFRPVSNRYLVSLRRRSRRSTHLFNPFFNIFSAVASSHTSNLLSTPNNAIVLMRIPNGNQRCLNRSKNVFYCLFVCFSFCSMILESEKSSYFSDYCGEISGSEYVSLRC